MALNLSTLTSPATSGDVLAEALTTADFLEPVPVLRNLARGSQKGGDAKQGTALNQPKALPLDANGKGYLYLSGVSGNYASVPHAANLNGITDFVMEARDVYMSDWATGSETFFAKYGNTTKTFTFRRSGANINFYSEGHNHFNFTHGLTGAATASIRLTRAGTSVTAELDTGSGYAAIGSALTINTAQLLDVTDPVEIGARQEGTNQLLTGKIGQIRLWKNATSSGTPVLDVDFTATNVRHGDTKFKCATGQVVTINQSGNDPATIIKKPVLRFDGVNDCFQGLFNQTIDGGYMFAAFSVLGDSGEAFSRIFSVNSNGADDNTSSGGIFSIRNAASSTLDSFYQGNYRLPHVEMLDDANGDILHEVKITNGNQSSLVNDANLQTATSGTAISSEGFNIVSSAAPSNANNNAAIDLEYLALFPATITDAQADSVRNYINNRNNVFDLKDGFGYYFFDAQKAPAVPITSGSSSWNGRIVGSDNGDANKYATQSTSNDSPVGDGFKVTFADNTDHLDIPSTTQAGWQIVGTSLGTFVYRVDNDAVTELNLLGNFGNASVRRAGDLYGVMLLPESASSADIEAAKKLLIDRGAAESATASNYYASWYGRVDIVEFGQSDTSNITAIGYAWFGCNNMTKFPPLDLSSCVDFDSAWRFAGSLSSFPAGAKLGTAASNVNFTSAWKSSGLTSFPALDLSTGNNFRESFQSCTALTTIEDGILLGTSSSSVDFTSAFKACTALTTLPSNLDLSKGDDFQTAFQNCQSLVNFPANAFDTMGTPQSYCFLNTWLDNNALSAASVENILVSINTSGQSAPSTGPEITIKYNTATGTPAYSTLASLKGKGWVVIVNGVTL